MSTTHLKKPIGILGGTFDPIHCGHLQLAEHVRKQLVLSDIRLIPCFRPPHRGMPDATPVQRLQMVKLAAQHMPHLTVDDREIKRQGSSYTCDTLQSLRLDCPNTPLCLITGSDSFFQLPTWYKWQELLHYAHFIVVERPHVPMEIHPELKPLLPGLQTTKVTDLHQTLAGKIYRLPMQPLNVSATSIREDLQQNTLIPDTVLPKAVYDYIQKYHIYRSDSGQQP